MSEHADTISRLKSHRVDSSRVRIADEPIFPGLRRTVFSYQRATGLPLEEVVEALFSCEVAA